LILSLFFSVLLSAHDDNNARYYIDLAKQAQKEAPEKSLEYLQQALLISIRNENKNDQLECYLLIGTIDLESKLYESGLLNIQKARSLHNEIQIKKVTKQANRSAEIAGEINLQLANAMELNGRNADAIIILENKANFVTKAQKKMASLLLAKIYRKQKSYDKSLNQYENLLKESGIAVTPNDLALINTKIAEVYKDQKIPEKSMEYLNKAKLEALESKDSDLIQEINSLLSAELGEKSNYKEEMKIREQNLAICIQKKDTNNYVNEAVTLAYLYIRSNQFSKAEDLVNRVLYFAQSNHKHIKYEALAYKAKAIVYQLNGNYPLSNTYYKYYANAVDTLMKHADLKETNNLKASTIFAEKQKQIDLLEKDAIIQNKTIEALSHAQAAIDARMARQTIIIWSLAVVVILVFLSSFLLYKNAQRRRLANQLLALKSLRSQMNPHFIFNALNSVNSFISINDEKSANKYLADFSRLMRMVMENSQHEFISLSQELEILSLYLSLEHFRFKDKFEYEFKVDETIDSDFVSIPPMIIQPHIENAVWHGLRYKQDMGKLLVSVRKCEEDMINIVIEDNGIGRKLSHDLKTKNQKANKSTGIKNTESRIQLIKEIYGRDISINIADAYPGVVGGIGTKVEILIPAHLNQEKNA
jgi:tetratricopeptide (TPR) repeat protein